jgi:colanic acid/amylovoran biosynthesis glycosyltransferase
MEKTVQNLGCPPEKTIVQHLGVDLRQFAFKPREWSPEKVLRILIAASFQEKKGIPFALQAIAEIAKVQQVAITIIGDANNSPRAKNEKLRIIETAKKCQLEEKIVWLGYQPHSRMISEAYKHDIFVSTSVEASDGDTEGGAPVAIIEMAASGMPIISSLHCDIPGVVLDRKTGWLAQEKNVDSIVGCLRDAIDSHGEWGEMCKAGRQHLEERFCLVRQGQKLARIYESIQSSRN